MNNMLFNYFGIASRSCCLLILVCFLVYVRQGPIGPPGEPGDTGKPGPKVHFSIFWVACSGCGGHGGAHDSSNDDDDQGCSPKKEVGRGKKEVGGWTMLLP